MRTKTIRQHGDVISLVGVYGKSSRFDRERLLGYILLFVGNPIVHAYTWYVTLCYSDEENVCRKDLDPILTDDNIRLLKVGIGACDYMFLYKSKTKKHDESGFSDGAAHLMTADNWKDGIY